MPETGKHRLNISRLVIEKPCDDFIPSDLAQRVQKLTYSLGERYRRLWRFGDLVVCLWALDDKSEKSIDLALYQGGKYWVKKLGPLLETIKL
jgi:hypothetical protein